MSSRQNVGTAMSPILLMTLIIVAVFACAFGLCEWIAGGRRSGGGGSLASPRAAGVEPEPDEGPKAAARRRVAQWLERKGDPDGD